MAENKEIRISAKMDSSQFNSEIKNLEEKLKSLQKAATQKNTQMSGLTSDSQLGPAAQKAIEQSQSRLNTLLKAGLDTQKDIIRIAEQQKRNAIDEIRNAEKLGNVDKERLKNLREFVVMKDRDSKQALQKAAIYSSNMPQTGNIGQAGGAMIPPPTSPTSGIAQTNAAGFEGLSTILQGIGVGAILKGAINASVKFVEHRIERDSKMLSDKAGAATVAATGLREMAEGRGATGAYWAQERDSAMQMAMERQSNVGNLDYAKGAGRGILGGIAGIGAGAMIGGSLGAIGGFMVGGPLGAYAGASLGADVGMGVGGIAGAGAGMMTDRRSYNRYFDSDAYNAMSSKEAMEQYQANLQKKKAADPRKAMGEELYYSDYPSQIERGRGLGLNTTEMLGRPQIKGQDYIPATPASAGHWTHDAWGNRKTWVSASEGNPGQSPILGSGGSEGYEFQGLSGDQKFSPATMSKMAAGLEGSSTEMQQGGRVTAASYERNYNMLNSSAFLNSQGQSGLSVGQSEQNLQKMLTDAMTTGMDKSKISQMPQELQKFSQSVIEMASSYGSYSGKTSQQMAAALGQDTPSLQDISTAKSAVQTYEEKASESSAMGYAYWHKLHPNMDVRTMQRMNKISSKQFSSMSDFDKEGLADELTGGDVDKLSKEFSGADADKQFMQASADKANKAYGEFQTTHPGITQENYKRYLSPEDQIKFRKLGRVRAGFISQENSGMNQRAVGSYGNLNSDAQMGFLDQATTVNQGDLESAKLPPDLAALAQANAAAVSAKTGKKGLRDTMSDLTTAGQTFSENDALFAKSFSAFQEAVKLGATGLDQFADSIKKVMLALGNNSSNQSTATGKPSSNNFSLPGLSSPYKPPGQ